MSDLKKFQTSSEVDSGSKISEPFCHQGFSFTLVRCGSSWFALAAWLLSFCENPNARTICTLVSRIFQFLMLLLSRLRSCRNFYSSASQSTSSESSSCSTGATSKQGMTDSQGKYSKSVAMFFFHFLENLEQHSFFGL
jgi:hypothetical protein